MKARKIIAVSASVLMLLACSAPPPKPVPPPQVAPLKLDMNDAQTVAGASIVKRDEYKNATYYKGPNLASKQPDQLFISAWKTDAGSVTYQIYVIINYSGAWRFYNEAKDTKGNVMDITLMTRNLAKCTRNDCLHNEHLVIDVTQKFLEENKQNGLRFKLSGKAGGDEVLFIPSGYIKTFLTLPYK